jgi:hypothetical protein
MAANHRHFFMEFIVLFGLPVALFSVTYHVGPAQTYHTLQEITDLLQPGDSALVDGDTTYPGGVVFTEAGTPAAPIVIFGVRINDRRPVISGGTNTVHFESPWPCTTGADHYRFEGFEVVGGSFRGIYHQADDLTIRDVLVRDCPAHGILGADQGSGSCLMEFVEVRDCGSGSSQHQVYMATDEVNRPGSIFRMQFCYLHDAKGGNNVKSRAERNEIYYNWVEGGYYHELELIGPDPGGAPSGWYPRLKREDSDVVGNVLRKRGTGYGNDSNFSVTRIGGDATGESHGRYRFVNNTILSGTGAVFRCFDSLESVEMHNNVFYRPAGGVNIMRVVEANWTQDSAVISGSNNWVYQGAANIPAVWTGTIMGTDPGFRDYATADYRPEAGSQLLDAANDDPLSPSGFPFPAPLFPPAFHPPLHACFPAAEARPVYSNLDIAAYEYTPTGIEENTGSVMKMKTTVWPQPFRTRVNIRWTTDEGRRTQKELLHIYDCSGRLIKTFAVSSVVSRPSSIVSWDGQDDLGRKMPAGVYLFVIKAGTSLGCGSVVKIE